MINPDGIVSCANLLLAAAGFVAFYYILKPKTKKKGE